ncbi:MAG: Prolipoprotein diacylglyceryl transferase [Proteobacteria bacterium]|nr:Prolipoprotein diacylglyceryl transferase [Pseudomonadota bacterium]
MIPAEHAALVHGLFEAAALAIGAALYRVNKRRAGGPGILAPGEFAVAVGCVFGAAIGNKVVFWIELPHLFMQYWPTPAVLFGGQSMVGGLLGGLIGVEIAKKLTGITRSTGDAFVMPVLLGLAIGRVGCFLAGLEDGTFGVATELPWGIDFGDGIRRHPTQLYEIAFAGLLAWALAHWRERLADRPGLSFKLMVVAYLAWRLAVDGIKPVPYVYPLGLSGIQWVCLLALMAYLPATVRLWAAQPGLPEGNKA